MDFLEGLKKAKKICSIYSNCDKCPIKNDSICYRPYKWQNLEKFVKMVEDWKPAMDWSKVAVDTPILVWNEGGPKYKRYFAKYENGRLFAWRDGCNSWSANGKVNNWHYGEIADIEE